MPETETVHTERLHIDLYHTKKTIVSTTLIVIATVFTVKAVAQWATPVAHKIANRCIKHPIEDE